MLPRVYLGFESLAAGRGGIARVARLVAMVLSEEARAGRLDVDGLVYSDRNPLAYPGLHLRTSRGSRLRYLAAVHRAAFGHSHFIYDFLGMARSHCLWPGLRRPFMVWMYGIEVWEQARADRIRWARRANVALACSDYTRQHAEALHGHINDTRTCWLGTESDEEPSGVVATEGPPSVLIVGRLEPGRDKGHAALIESWPTVTDACPEARLVIVGTGRDAGRLQALARHSGVGDRIDFTGFVSEARLESLYAEATVYAMPSRGEGFGLVYIEAMRHGLSVVASVHDAAPEVVIDGQTGYTVDLDRNGELADRLIHLLRHPDEARTMGASGRERWRRHFSYSAFKQRFLVHLHSLFSM